MRTKEVFHRIFNLGIIIKGIDGILEIIGGIVLYFISSATLARIVGFLFQGELVEDPGDIFANSVMHASVGFSHSTQILAASYLLFHGIVKIGIIWGLWEKKLWAYPLAGIVMAAMIIYQLIRVTYTHSIILLFLTLTDVVIIVLLKPEYEQAKLALGKPKTPKTA